MLKRSNNRLQKVLAVVLILMLILPFIPAFVPEAKGETGGSAQTTSSMINFFRDKNTKVNAKAVTRDEIITYGVFISNFFMPGETTIADLTDGESENSISKRVAMKFFGSSEKKEDVATINVIVSDAIKDIVSKESSYLYEDEKSTKRLTGERLFEIFSETDKDNLVIYSQPDDVRKKIDLNDSAMKAVMKILYGYAPALIFDKQVGLRSMGELFIDGFGNIWGIPLNSEATNGLDVSNYVLLLPACLNPITFAKGSENLKFPVNNAFVMGATTTITNGTLKSGMSLLTPYYSIPQKLKVGNMTSIYGIASPYTAVGKSDLLFSDVTPHHEAVKAFTNGEIKSENRVLIVAVDSNKSDIEDTAIKAIPEEEMSEDNKLSLIAYFNDSTVIPLDNTYSTMYWFNDDIQSADATSTANWKGTEKLNAITGLSLFTKGTDFYADSTSFSPFVLFLADYMGLSNDSKDEFIEKNAPELDDAEIKILRGYLDKGLFDSDDGGDIEKILKTLTLNGDKDRKLVYGILEPSLTSTSQVTSKDFWKNLFGTESFSYSSLGLTTDDKSFAIMSAGTSSDISFQGEETLDELEELSHSPFKATFDGGKLENSILSSLSEDENNALANILYNFTAYRVFGVNYAVAKQLTGVAPSERVGPQGKFETKTKVANDVNHWAGIYWAYMVEMLNITQDSNNNFSSPIKYSNPVLPYMTINVEGSTLDLNKTLTDAGVANYENKSFEEMQKDIVKKIYGLLQEGPNAYRDSLTKATQDSWIISTHRSITGSWIGNVLSVSSGIGGNYSSVVGYINTPNLRDLPFTAWLLDNYMQIYVLLLLLIAMLLVVMTIANIRTWQESVTIFFLMAVILVLPQSFLNNAIGLSNKFGDMIYSDRFNYWALTQHEQSYQSLLNSASSANELDYTITQNMEKAKNTYSSDAGVRVKWMSPKKSDVFERLFSSDVMNQDLATNLSIFKWLFSSFFYQEEYVNGDPLASYIYRPYNAIATDALDSYDALQAKPVDPSKVKSAIDDKLKTMLGASETRFNLLDKDYDKVNMTQEQLDIIAQVSAYGKKDKNYRYWAISSDEVTKKIFRSDYTDDDDAGLKLNLTSADVNTKMFLLYTESPFYYFYDVLKYRYSENGGFKANLLEDELYRVKNTENPQVNNKVRDFLDLQGLFTNVVPYLAQGNDYVFGWTGKYGKTVDDYNFANAPEEEQANSAFLEAQTKKKHLEQVWNMYSPWVASLYDTNVLNKKAGIARKSVVVRDSLNPGSYDAEGRPMIFSEADMSAKHYQVSDLTDVELKMQQVLNKTYEDMQYLVNYRDFSDPVLLTAAAMLATFNFNREFSSNPLIGDTVTLYPQGFELKNFNYDAFMRLTLMNSTGESLMSNQDLYVRVLSKTSIVTGLLLLAEDIIAVVIIPTAKMIILLMLLFLGLLMCVSSVVQPPEKVFKTINTALFIPTMLFMVFSIIFSFVVSLFVGEGLTSYVGSRTPSMTTNDPTITIFLLIMAGIIYTFCLLYLIKMIVASYKSFGVAAFFGTLGAVAGASTILSDKFKRVASRAIGSGVSTFSDYMSTRKEDKYRGDVLDGLSGGNHGVPARPSGGSTGTSTNTSQDASNSNSSPSRNPDLADNIAKLTAEHKDDISANSETITPNNNIGVFKQTVVDTGKKLVQAKYLGRDAMYKVQDGAQSVARGTSNIGKVKGKVASFTADVKREVDEYDYATQSKRVEVLRDKNTSNNIGSRAYEEKASLRYMQNKRSKEAEGVKNNGWASDWSK